MAEAIRTLRQRLQADESSVSENRLRDTNLFKKVVLALFVFTATAVVMGKRRDVPRPDSDDPLFQPL